MHGGSPWRGAKAVPADVWITCDRVPGTAVPVKSCQRAQRGMDRAFCFRRSPRPCQARAGQARMEVQAWLVWRAILACRFGNSVVLAKNARSFQGNRAHRSRSRGPEIRHCRAFNELPGGAVFHAAAARSAPSRRKTAWHSLYFFSLRRRKCSISPTMPRRNSSTEATNTVPITTGTGTA